jgi:lycopene cyclase domain-containing protein
MKSLYIILNVGSFVVPFLFSFHPKLKFYKHWKYLFPAIFITMLVFIPWDIIFTVNGFWGFNPDYYLAYTIFSLPIEEWLFFTCIPYACIFTHYSLQYLYPNMRLSAKTTKIISYILLLIFTLGAIIFYDKWYTVIDLGYGAILLFIVMKALPKILETYYLTFLVMLIPFFIVNGVLTGTGIAEPVVWYNNAENLGIRLGTVPVEDTVYAFTMILSSLFLMQLFGKRKSQ